MYKLQAKAQIMESETLCQSVFYIGLTLMALSKAPAVTLSPGSWDFVAHTYSSRLDKCIGGDDGGNSNAVDKQCVVSTHFWKDKEGNKDYFLVLTLDDWL